MPILVAVVQVVSEETVSTPTDRQTAISHLNTRFGYFYLESSVVHLSIAKMHCPSTFMVSYNNACLQK